MAPKGRPPAPGADTRTYRAAYGQPKNTFHCFNLIIVVKTVFSLLYTKGVSYPQLSQICNQYFILTTSKYYIIEISYEEN